MECANPNIQNAIGDIPVQPALMRENLEVVSLIASTFVNHSQASCTTPRLTPRTHRSTSRPVDIYLENKEGQSVAKMVFGHTGLGLSLCCRH